MMRRLISIAALGLSAGAFAAPNREAEAVVDGFHSALTKGDTRAAAALLAEDALIFEEGGAERSKGEYAAHHLPADAAFSQVVSSATMRRSSDASADLAWVASEGRSKGSYKDRTIDQLTTETMVLRRTAAGWKIVHVHWSSAPAKGR